MMVVYNTTFLVNIFWSEMVYVCLNGIRHSSVALIPIWPLSDLFTFEFESCTTVISSNYVVILTDM